MHRSISRTSEPLTPARVYEGSVANVRANYNSYQSLHEERSAFIVLCQADAFGLQTAYEERRYKEDFPWAGEERFDPMQKYTVTALVVSECAGDKIVRMEGKSVPFTRASESRRCTWRPGAGDEVLARWQVLPR